MSLVLEELAHHVVAAVYAKQIPIVDLLGFSGHANCEMDIDSDGHLVFTRADGTKMLTHLDGNRLQAFSRLVLESYIDADGTSGLAEPAGFAPALQMRHVYMVLLLTSHSCAKQCHASDSPT